MGTNPLTKKDEIMAGETRKPEHIADLYDALNGPLVPRDANGNVAGGQDLGTAAAPFGTAHITNIQSVTALETKVDANKGEIDAIQTQVGTPPPASTDDLETRVTDNASKASANETKISTNRAN